MMSEPTIRLEVMALGERITSMLARHAEECNALVRTGIEKALEDMDIPAIAAEAAKPAIRKAVVSAVESYFEFGDGRKLIDRIVVESMKSPKGDAA